MAIRYVGSTEEVTVAPAALSHLLLLPANMVPFTKVSRHNFFTDDFLINFIGENGASHKPVTFAPIRSCRQISLGSRRKWESS